MTDLYQNQQIRTLESLTIKERIIDEAGLMHNAGKAAYRALHQAWPKAKKIIVCCGKGNNAGDGFIVARLAHEQGADVSVFTLSDIDQLKNAAKAAAQAAKAAGVVIQTYQPNSNLQADVIVDALLGSGIQGEVSGVFAEFIDAINAANCPVLAIDVPSGLDVDTGRIHGAAVQANLTMTFIAYKQGLFTDKAPAYCGELHCDDLGIPESIFKTVNPTAKLLAWQEIKTLLPKRRRDTHKGDYGHVLVIGGDYGMGGAVRMAAEAAMRVGSGLVSVATRPEHVPVVSCSRPEIMCHQVAEPEDLDPLLARANVIVIGPGLGKSDWAKSLLNRILQEKLPKLVDADALNLLSELPKQAEDWVLTPHPGEASRLLSKSSQRIQDDRFAAVEALQKRYGGVVVLKGSGTLIKGPVGLVKVCAAGNPGMASGGMGDILSGVIGGLMAQGLSNQVAAEAGVLLHAMAADRQAAECGERGLLATDLLADLRKLVNPCDDSSSS